MGSLGVRVYGSSTGATDDQVHRNPAQWRAAFNGDIGGAVELARRGEDFAGGNQLRQGAARHHVHADILFLQFFDEWLALRFDHGADDPRAGVFAGDAHVVLQRGPQQAVKIFWNVGRIQVTLVVGEADVG